MKSPFDLNRPTRPFLAPLTPRRRSPREFLDRLPPFAAPVAVTVVGGLALVVALGAYLSGTAGTTPPPAEVAAATAPAATIAEQAPAEAGDAPALRTEADPEQAAADATFAPETRDEAATPETGEMDLASTADTPDPTQPPAGDGLAGVVTPLDGETTETAAAGDAVPAAPDPGRTSAIPPARPGGDALAPEVQVAETEEEIAALEAIQQREVEADVGPPSQEWTSAVDTTPPARLVAATTTKWVNMRNGPSDEAEVLMVVPALDEIQAETGCNWCAVTYDGQTGFIYKTFISYAGEEPATNEATATE